MKRVLIADDHAITRRGLRELLQDAYEGLQVIEVGNADAAIEQACRDDFDLVLLDVLMPGLTGIEVLKMIRAMPQTANLPVIMISEFTRDDEVVRGLEIDDADYLLKPIDLDALLARVETYLSRRE